MKHYFIAVEDIQTGPFTYEDILSKKITKTTLIWTEGLDDWKEANQIEELKNILISEPPPIPKKAIIPPKNEIEDKVTVLVINDEPVSKINVKYDNIYEKETNFSIIGIAIIVFTLIANYQLTINEENTQLRLILILISLIIRIGAALTVQKIALRQNRKPEQWIIFGFLFPSLALIIIGQLKKLKKLDIYENPKMLFKRAKKLYQDKKYNECLLILDEILENHNQNFDYIKFRAQVLFDHKNYESAEKDLEKLVNNNQYLDYAYNNLGEIAILNKNKETAISYWIKAKELYCAEAIKNLNLYQTYEYQYVLNKNQAQQKTQKNINFQPTYFQDGKYIRGLAEIDDFENTNSLSTNITLYDMGICIELSKTLKTFFIAISYYEIDNIIYNEKDKLFTLVLNDKKELMFKYDIEKDDNLGIQKLQSRFNDLMVNSFFEVL